MKSTARNKIGSGRPLHRKSDSSPSRHAPGSGFPLKKKRRSVQLSYAQYKKTHSQYFAATNDEVDDSLDAEFRNAK